MISPSRLSPLVLIAGFAACATVQQSVEGPAAAIRAAEEMGAAGVPEAALPLQLAKEQLERAKTMTSENEQPAAKRLLMCSQVDAELALALARSTEASSAARKATARTRSIENTVR
jgi:hypothetical protein